MEIKIVRGDPADDEIAALVAVLSALASRGGRLVEPDRRARTPWAQAGMIRAAGYPDGREIAERGRRLEGWAAGSRRGRRSAGGVV